MYQPESKIDKNYFRVLPRDLFNEAKLLKCIGRLVILIDDGFALNGMSFNHNGGPFKIGLVADGHLTVTNIIFEINGVALFFKSGYNSKENYPLLCEHERCEYEIFDEEGKYTDEFVEFCEKIATNNL